MSNIRKKEDKRTSLSNQALMLSRGFRRSEGQELDDVKEKDVERYMSSRDQIQISRVLETAYTLLGNIDEYWEEHRENTSEIEESKCFQDFDTCLGRVKTVLKKAELYQGHRGATFEQLMQVSNDLTAYCTDLSHRFEELKKYEEARRNIETISENLDSIFEYYNEHEEEISKLTVKASRYSEDFKDFCTSLGVARRSLAILRSQQDKIAANEIYQASEAMNDYSEKLSDKLQKISIYVELENAVENTKVLFQNIEEYYDHLSEDISELPEVEKSTYYGEYNEEHYNCSNIMRKAMWYQIQGGKNNENVIQVIDNLNACYICLYNVFEELKQYIDTLRKYKIGIKNTCEEFEKIEKYCNKRKEYMLKIKSCKYYQDFEKDYQEFTRVLDEAELESQGEWTTEELFQILDDVNDKYINLYISFKELEKYIDNLKEIQNAIQNNRTLPFLDDIDKLHDWQKKDIVEIKISAEDFKYYQDFEKDYQGFTRAFAKAKSKWQGRWTAEQLQTLYDLGDQQKQLSHSFEELVTCLVKLRSKSTLTLDELRERYELSIRPLESVEKGFMKRAKSVREKVLKSNAIKMDMEEYLTKMDEKAVEIVKNKEIWIGCDTSELFQILKHRRFRSEIEKGASLSVAQVRVQVETEKILFGYPDKMDVKLRPVCGYLTDRSDGTVGNQAGLLPYGFVAIHIKGSSNIRQRTTVIMGDSVGSYLPGADSSAHELLAKPALYTSPNRDMFPIGDPLEPLSDPLSYESIHDISPYVEVQIHGGLSGWDIEEVVFRDPAHPLVPALKRLLYELNIPWKDL